MPDNEKFDIVVQRLHVDKDLVIGAILVNGEQLGTTYENDAVKIAAGHYTGMMRYSSNHNFVQGPEGTMSKAGDFLIEVVGVKGRSAILFHGGNKAKHSRGCILLGPVHKKKKHAWVDDGHTLRKLRRKFYGSDNPVACPMKTISVRVFDVQKERTITQ